MYPPDLYAGMRTPNNRLSGFLDPPPVITITDVLLSVDEDVRPGDYCMMVETCRGCAEGFIYYLRLIVRYSTNCMKHQGN
jgi:hypothetical protein